jgi:hypothetical protein
MRCGQASALYKDKTFSWYPPWVGVLILAGLLPYLILVMVMTKRMTVSVPLCQQHKNHWLIRNLLILGILAVVAVLVIGGFVLTAAFSDQLGQRGGDLSGFICLAGGVLFLAWLIAVVIIQATAIKPSEITDDTITLNRVSDAFVDAVEEARDQDEEEYRARPRARRERSDRVVDPKAPRRRPAPPDDYREGEE